MSGISDPFAAPAEAGERPRQRWWPLVRFLTRRLLLVGVIPLAVAVVGGSLGGVEAMLVAWAIPLLLWIPSSLVLLRVHLADTPADPRAVELADGRVLSRRDCALYIGARAWESATTALMLPVMALGFARFAPLASIGLAALLAIVPAVLLRYQWLGVQGGRAVLHIASDRPAEAEALLERVGRARFVAPSFAKPMAAMHALAIARQGRVDEALAIYATLDTPAARLGEAQLLVGRGETQAARDALDTELGGGFGAEIGRPLLEAMLALHEGQPQAVVEAAARWGGLQQRVSLHTARLFDLLHALALEQAGRHEAAWTVLRRRDTHTDDWPWFDTVYPQLAPLRHQLLEGGGE